MTEPEPSPPSRDLGPLLAALPPAVRTAIEEQDVQALDLALRALPAEQAAAVLRRLVEAGLLAARTDDDLDAEQRAAYDEWSDS